MGASSFLLELTSNEVWLKLYGLQHLIILTTYRYLFLPIAKVEYDKILSINVLITPDRCMKGLYNLCVNRSHSLSCNYVWAE